MFGFGKSVNNKKGEKIKISPLEFLILANIRRRELLKEIEVGQYGNAIIRDLNDLFQGSWEAQSGTIYPILSKMDDYKGKDLLQSENIKTELGPVKKIYTMTENGRYLIDEIMLDNYYSEVEFVDRYSEFLSPFKKWVDESSKTREKKQIVPSDQIECPSCNENCPVDAFFCSRCGAKLVE